MAGAFANPDAAGQGQHLSLAGDLVSWNDLVATLNSQGHDLAFVEAKEDPWGMSDMFGYFAEYTYFGPDAESKIAAAEKVTTKPFTDFATWSRQNMPVPG